MAAFERIDQVGPTPQFGNTGPPGWGFVLWGDPNCEEEVHRRLLETFAAAHPGTSLVLPPFHDCEDLIEGSMIWSGHTFWVWFETVLNHTYLWSSDREAVERIRDAILPLAELL
jgi:hypothetical protein